MILTISCSLNVASRSRVLARIAHEHLSREGISCEIVDLCDHPLPLCDAGSAYGHPSVARLACLIEQAKGVLLAAPVYNYDLNAAAKNLLELTGKAWTGKVVGFVCAAGGESSYMSVMPFANSLMLDYRCVIVPRFVYVTGKAFNGDRLENTEIEERVRLLARDMDAFSRALDGITETAN